ncbi:MAG: hypothetical protein RLN72_01630, partial [Henriciella sp.]
MPGMLNAEPEPDEETTVEEETRRLPLHNDTTGVRTQVRKSLAILGLVQIENENPIAIVKP